VGSDIYVTEVAARALAGEIPSTISMVIFDLCPHHTEQFRDRSLTKGGSRTLQDIDRSTSVYRSGSASLHSAGLQCVKGIDHKPKRRSDQTNHGSDGEGGSPAQSASDYGSEG